MAMVNNANPLNSTANPPDVTHSQSVIPTTIPIPVITPSQARANFNTRNSMQHHNSNPIPYAARECVENYFIAPWSEMRQVRDSCRVRYDGDDLAFLSPRPIVDLHYASSVCFP